MCNDTNIQELLPAYLEKALEPVSRIRVERHLASCEDCRAELALLSLIADDPVPAPDEVFWVLSNAYKDQATGDNATNTIGSQYFVTDWTQQHANFFKAVQMEKRVMFIILALIVAVAAFNIVSTLVMAVTDKRADIAIMRTFGASPRSIMGIFMVQGALIGVIGTIAGAVVGVIIALNIDTIVPFIEGLFHVQFLAKDVYYISDLPSKLEWNDVITIVLMSFGLSLIATLYPSYKASQINPAEALRYE